MKSLIKVYLFFILLILGTDLSAQQLSLCSWNIQNFGKSKSDNEIKFIAQTLKNFDVVCIIEVVAGYGGAQAVARLSDELNRTGSAWDYTISDPTSSFTKGTERYAFLWRKSKLKKTGNAWLDKQFQNEIEREPYYITLISGKQTFTIGVFHAIPTSKHPETEIPFLAKIAQSRSNENLIFCGDFNCAESNTAFASLKQLGFSSAMQHQKTTLKSKQKGNECLASEYDNVFYKKSKIKVEKTGIIPFHESFSDLKSARMISDHLPIYFNFSLH